MDSPKMSPFLIVIGAKKYFFSDYWPYRHVTNIDKA